MTNELPIQNAKDAKKLKILLAAEQMFVEKGYHNTTVEYIAKAAGIGKSTFYEYFTSKDEVLQTAVNVGAENFFNILLAEYKNCGTVREKITATVYCSLVVSAIHGDSLQAYIPLMLHNSSQEFSGYVWEKLGGSFFSILRNILVEGMNNGEIAEQDADLLAHMLLGFIGGSIHYQRGTVQTPDLGEMIRLLAEDDQMEKIRRSDLHRVCREQAEQVEDLFWQGVGKK